ncbi:MAG: 2-C-methyl-D-erythritol 2,4-cyclodiphosphate synthase [SAR202 cluster bacterium]|nr:2-C-methyl-D-erythritol 2,4-cyclodiphosphate synthase [SAR202 cluster bacterium]
MTLRVGSGLDAHPLVAGRRLVLGGVPIPHEKGIQGHSDGDVAVHAIMDALLGAAGLGDKGKHFPSTDPTLKGISSLILLQRVGALVRERGWRIVNVDATILAQRPRLSPFVEQMRKNVSRTLSVGPEIISIKATTTDNLGFTGRGEGIAAHAVALIETV